MQHNPTRPDPTRTSLFIHPLSTVDLISYEISTKTNIVQTSSSWVLPSKLILQSAPKTRNAYKRAPIGFTGPGLSIPYKQPLQFGNKLELKPTRTFFPNKPEHCHNGLQTLGRLVILERECECECGRERKTKTRHNCNLLWRRLNDIYDQLWTRTWLN